VIGLARSFGRYGYKRITGLLQMAGWNVNPKRVQRIWRREGLKVPARQPRRGRLWLADGSRIRLRPEHGNHVWAYDFVAEKTHDGRPPKPLCVADEYTRDCLAVVVARRITSSRQKCRLSLALSATLS
jgi:transposase InsO family protein